MRTAQGEARRYRFRFEKIGATALLGHLDLLRAVPRVFRRVGIAMAYSLGFHPKPEMTFSPALSLGVMSLGEYVDVKLLADVDPASMLDRMNAAAPDGLVFTAGARLGPDDPAITKVVAHARYLLAFARTAIAPLGGEAWLAERVAWAIAQPEIRVRREIDGIGKVVDVRAFLAHAALGDAGARALVARAGLVGDLVVLDATARIPGSGAVKCAEIVEAITGESSFPHRAVRASLAAERDGSPVDPMDLARLRRARAAGLPAAARGATTPDP